MILTADSSLQPYNSSFHGFSCLPIPSLSEAIALAGLEFTMESRIALDSYSLPLPPKSWD